MFILDWDVTKIANAFEIYWTTGSDPEQIIRSENGVGRYALQNLSPATMYNISVAAVFGTITSERSEVLYKGTGMILIDPVESLH